MDPGREKLRKLVGFHTVEALTPNLWGFSEMSGTTQERKSGKRTEGKRCFEVIGVMEDEADEMHAEATGRQRSTAKTGELRWSRGWSGTTTIICV